MARTWFTMKRVNPTDEDYLATRLALRAKAADDDDKDKEKDDDEEDDDDEKQNPFAEIMIYDEIGKSFWNENAVGAKAFVDSLNALGDIDDIVLRINSPGGDVFDGMAIHNALKTHKAKVTARVDGIAASIASYIAMAADKIIMPKNSFMLLHNASGFAMGTAEDMRATANDLDAIDKSIIATYSARSGQSAAKVRALLKEDRLMDAREAKQLGYADSVTRETKMTAKFPLRLLSKPVADYVRLAFGDPEPEPQPKPVPQPDPKPAPQGDPTDNEAGVVALNAARKEGIADHKAYVASVTDLCVLANMADRVGGYVRAGTKVEEVRKELLALRAKQQPVLPHHPLLDPKPDASTWDKIVAKLNKRK